MKRKAVTKRSKYPGKKIKPGRPPVYKASFSKKELKKYNLKSNIDKVTEKILDYAIKRCKGSLTSIAELIGMNRSYTWRLLQKFNMRRKMGYEKKSKK